MMKINDKVFEARVPASVEREVIQGIQLNLIHWIVFD